MYPITGACSVMRWCGTQNPECALTICCSHGRPTYTRALNTQQPLCVWDGWLLPTFLHQFETGGLNSMICFPCTHFSSRLGCCFSHLDLYPLINRRQTSIGITSADAGHQTKKNCTRIQSTNNTKSCLLLACRVFFIYVQSCLAREKNNHLRSFFEWIEYTEYLIKSSAGWALCDFEMNCVMMRWSDHEKRKILARWWPVNFLWLVVPHKIYTWV